MRWLATSSALTFTALICLCFMVGELSSAINAAPHPITLNYENTMEPTTASWISGGITITVSKTQRELETDGDFAKRMREAVDAMLVQFPKDAP